MSSTTFQPSLSLGYLDEQQRFRRTVPKPIAKSQPVISDIRPNLSKPLAMPTAVRPLPTQPVLQNAPHTYGPTPQTPPLSSPVPNQTKATTEIFSEQFGEAEKVHHSRLRKLLPVIVASVALVAGLTVLGFSLHQNHQAAAQVAAIVEKSEAGPSEDGPPAEAPVSQGAINAYKVAADQPRTITIKSINVYARVLPMGILSSGALATPRNTNDAGWYSGSSKPDENGASLIVGHVSGPTNVGLFYNLKKLNTGDVITVEKGDGTKVDYKVVKKQAMPSGDVNMSDLLVPVTPGKGGLNLMTCTGKYIEKQETFTDRELVFAEKV